MYPLLVTAIASTASNLLERWSAAAASHKPAPSAAEFHEVLDKVAASSPSATASLRARLLDAPEIHSILDAADPAKPVAIQVAQDGTVIAHEPGRDPRAIAVSPETAELARKLATSS